MKGSIWVVAAGAASVLLATAGCSRSEAPTDVTSAPTASTEAVTPPADTQASAATGHRANLTPSQGGQVGGALDLVASDGAVTITGLVTGLRPDSEHGFHLHEKGDCSAPDFSSAGEHFNPTSQQHGNPASPPHHLGDAPNIKANAEGKADVNVRVEGVTLADAGANDVVGKSIVVHEKVDDYKTQPSGNSGDRIACGVIE